MYQVIILSTHINYTCKCCLNTFHEKHLKDTVCDKQLVILNTSIYSLISVSGLLRT